MNEKKEDFSIAEGGNSIIRKSIQTLNQGNVQNAPSNLEAKNQKLAACGKTVVDEIGEIEETNILRVKKYVRGRMDAGDCELRQTTLTLNSDGSYEEITEYHDHGRVFGDKFNVTINVHGPGGVGDVIAALYWKDTLGAGDDATIKNTGSQQVIKDNFDQIRGFYRSLTCESDIH
ncbi:hypothetical protein COE94_05945 [Bacillus toyonensis]|uniref:hypothetical protein n=1 Tax=Bacillus toyonensis TaxID=155322 RepID=UPI000BFBB896|nr:hypothetical protein [Bacillus toyonensis]PHB87477.1 hypothetical protein COE94_05945 [Bacillus toyonensis]